MIWVARTHLRIMLNRNIEICLVLPNGLLQKKALADAKREQKEESDTKLIQVCDLVDCHDHDYVCRTGIRAENEDQWPWWISSICEEEGSSTCPSWSTAEAMEIYCSSCPCHHQCCCWFHSLDGHPASIVEGEGFQQLLKLAEPRYVCPSRTYFQHVSNDAMLKFSFLSSVSCMSLQTYIPALYHKVKLLQKQALHDQFPSLARVSNRHLLPTRVLCCPAPILTILFRSQLTCGLDPTMSPTSALLLTGSTPHWQLHHALLDILLCTDRHTGENLVEWIKQVLHANDLCVWSIDPAFALLDFSLTVLCFFVAASWCWSSDSWSWCWCDESSAIERDPWLSMLWSWTRSHRQCWSWLSHFRSDLHQGFQRGFDHPILHQPLSQVARRSSKGVSLCLSWLCQASSVFLFV